MQHRSISFLIIMTLLVTTASAAKKENHEKENQVTAKLDQRQYTIEVDYANPQGGRSVPLSSSYSLRINNDTIHSHLPFFGRAYSIPYGGGEGLIFQAITSDYQAKLGKKGQHLITFTVQSADDTHRFSLTVFPNGSASIRVMPNNRSSINFIGKLTP